ncbi:MAG: hypothetical protein JNM70_23920 [Anaerolineae bacterium]|nr:hypothetical protein [Anaerolineae bacterium]
MSAIPIFADPAEAAQTFAGCRFLDAEFLYRPRPVPGRERLVFDAALRSRLSCLDARDAVLLICDHEATAASLEDFPRDFPRPRFSALIANPLSAPNTDTPQRLEWPEPDRWQRLQMTDRWARIDCAWAVAEQVGGAGSLLMPAHDAVWGIDLLPRLLRFSQRHARAGHNAAVSPYTPFQHSPVAGADIPPEIISLLNTAFGRDSTFPWRVRLDRTQAFWGKMSLTPFSLCGILRVHTPKQMWEDDLEIDSTLRQLDLPVRCLWIGDPAVYRQALPVFDEAGVRAVIERSLHYSLFIPGGAVGSSSLNVPLRGWDRLRARLSPTFRQANAWAERLIAECAAAIQARLDHYGASWLDWGGCRYVAQVGNPVVEVWRSPDHPRI